LRQKASYGTMWYTYVIYCICHIYVIYHIHMPRTFSILYFSNILSRWEICYRFYCKLLSLNLNLCNFL